MPENVLPLTLRMGALPLNFQATPQELADAIVERMEVLSSQEFALFVKGPSEPDSDVGPWMDTSSTIGIWKAFDYVTGQYEPMAIDSISLRYILAEDEPNNQDYDLWVKLNGSGKAVSLQKYFSGAWHDVYEDAFASTNAAIAAVAANLATNYSTTTTMNAAIADAIADIPDGGGGGAGTALFRARNGTGQLITGTGDEVLELLTEVFDTDNRYDPGSYGYTAPSTGTYFFTIRVNSQVNSGSPTGISVLPFILVNGGVNMAGGFGDNGTLGSHWQEVTTLVQLNTGDVVRFSIGYEIVGGGTFQILSEAFGYKVA